MPARPWLLGCGLRDAWGTLAILRRPLITSSLLFMRFTRCRYIYIYVELVVGLYVF